MTGFQLTRPRPGVAPTAAPWSPQAPAAESIRTGRHACPARARLSLRRLFYLARHAAR
jgi:hypothetical protein